MAKGTRGRRRIASRQCRPTPYPLPSCNQDVLDGFHSKQCPKILQKKDWEDATCSVCMEYPHNAVLLLCSSHDKGCRPYMCGTSSRYSNCLDQYKKAYTKMTSALHDQSSHGLDDNSIVGQGSTWPVEKCEVTELACPLCRGQVKGWTVVEPARDYLNAKKRSCMQDNCSFVGTYKELRRHVRAEHPCARPREVDPALEQKWRRLEREREREDVISTIRSSMPGAMVFGDYVIEGSHYGFDTDEEDGFDVDVTGRNEGFELGIDGNLVNVFLLLQAFGPGGNVGHNRRTRQRDRGSDRALDGSAVGFRHPSPVGGFDLSDQDSDGQDGGGDGGGMSLVHRLRRQGRILLGRSGRRQRRREASGGQR
ncbi:G-protein coupled receptor 15 like [Actinidia chinensis var. chinensis]|uniref:G-protein coupled receptor 15 like n=1 Tax=Actinidia chinensis var. chinensis TaxID=1590841 RepID=A0A2R6RDV8_ACTCC|nr:G-protein coupled receptor 15 like [Actinidia chinensis var. chinensis]